LSGGFSPRQEMVFRIGLKPHIDFQYLPKAKAEANDLTFNTFPLFRDIHFQ